MGMQQRVRLTSSVAPWEAVRDLLGRRGYPVRLVMIDGQLALPDETPSADWRELRVTTPQGMVTLRREANAVTLVTWGNADLPLRQAWNALTWACAAVWAGTVDAPAGQRDAEAFRAEAELPEALRFNAD